MDLEQYFKDANGFGVLSTADETGKVNAAIYSKPHMIDGYACFIMNKKLSKQNLDKNPYAHFLFMEKGEGYKGLRISLEKVKEVQDEELIASLSRRKEASMMKKENSSQYLVSFKIIKVVELIGNKEVKI
ncbi:MAG: pyridoxamine 5'-phosphate oxidase [Deltaproteobacteria bacterium]|nr:MAG: pyridoxamine 5'-phosphate oxidase [Deltaproteobacteria bacterium]